MRKLFLLNLSMLAIAASGVFQSHAQTSNADKLGARFIVEAPASIAGVKPFTFSSDGTTPWGGRLDTLQNSNNLEVVKASNLEACSAINSVAGKWVIIYRGNCEFGVKALNAQQAGAAGVIIYNHTPYELVNMAAGGSGGSVTIPVVFITNADGQAIINRLDNSEQVFISLSTWGFGKTHDLAIVTESQALSPGMAIPYHQLDGTDVPQYRGYTGASVANTGASTEADVKVVNEVTFTPTGGSSSLYKKDSAMVASFATTDSIADLFSANHFVFGTHSSPIQTGTYNFNYTVTANDADEYPADNSVEFSLNVTPNVFSRGRFDASTQQPVITGWNRIGGTATDFSWGPLFFNHKGGYHLSHLTFSLADNDTSRHSFVGQHGDIIEAYVFKWADANTDGMMTGDELELKGIAKKEFTTDDSARKPMTIFIGNAIDGSPAQLVSEDNTYYWIAFNLGTELRLSVDRMNYFNRTKAAKVTNSTADFWGPQTRAITSSIAGDASVLVSLIPFGVAPINSNNIDSTTYDQLGGATPAVALFTSVFTVNVPEVSKVDNNKLNVYPNPATDYINVKIDLPKQAEKVYVKVIDAFGRQVYSNKLSNVQNKDIQVSTASFAAGNYYVILHANGESVAKPFTVVGK